MNINILKEKVIKQEIAIENDTDVHTLNRVLSEIFPKDTTSNGGSKFYRYWSNHPQSWFPTDDNELPTIKVSEVTFDSFYNHIVELKKLRQNFPNNLQFGDEFDKYLNEFLK